jgi:hypothetical protein
MFKIEMQRGFERIANRTRAGRGELEHQSRYVGIVLIDRGPCNIWDSRPRNTLLSADEMIFRQPSSGSPAR